MLAAQPKPPLNFPDDPLKWDGWSNYTSANLYKRLCLDPELQPGDDQIQQHCAALLQWWQRKLPLKVQPSNPMAQLLGRGLDEAPRYLVEARMQLVDPTRRQQLDADLAAQKQQDALIEFTKFVTFSLAGKRLPAEAEANLLDFGQRIGLTTTQISTCIEEELQRNKAQRVTPPQGAMPAPTQSAKTRAESEMEFHRILCLSNLDLREATTGVRRIFATIAESLGIHFERGEQLLEDYLDRQEADAADKPLVPKIKVPVRPRVAEEAPAAPARTNAPAPRFHPVVVPDGPSKLPASFANPVGMPMVLIPAGEFLMGSDAPEAAPDEQPLTPVSLSEFYMSRYPVTNAQYEQFDPSHRQKRMKGADSKHPVVYVTSLEAVNYCEWLRQKDGKNYRLPTEAEWEYAARGNDGRIYPWGNEDRRRDLANFADGSTTFPWRDPLLYDGYPETSPVGVFSRGNSFFGLEDMAGNVWEWCLDFHHPLAGTPKRNPRSAANKKRVYRGGSWKSRFSNLRATARSSNAPSYSCNDVGFRIACECEGSEFQ